MSALKHPNTLTYLLRNIPKPLWRAAKKKAAAQQTNVREVLLALLVGYVAKRGERGR